MKTQVTKYPARRPQRQGQLNCLPAALVFFALSVHAQEQALPPPQFLEGVACPLFGCSDGPPLPALDCRLQEPDGAPQFKSGPPRAAYFFRGMCADANPGDAVSYRVTGTWNPSQTDPSQPNAAEVYLVTGDGGASYSQRIGFSAHCDADPWLTTAHCTRMGDTLPQSLHHRWPSIATARFPLTSNAIPLAERGPLHGEFNAINGIEYPSRPGTARAVEFAHQPGSMRATNTQATSEHLALRNAVGGTTTSTLDPSGQVVAGNFERDDPRMQPSGLADAQSHRAPGTYRRSTEWQRQAPQRSDRLQLLQPEDTIRVVVRYPVAYGYKSASELFASGPSSCDAFAVDAIPQHRSRDDRQPVLIKIAAMPGMRSSNGNYVCEYLVSYVPLDEPIDVSVRIGTPRNPSTEPWMGGEDAQPAPGQQRVIVNGARTVALTATQPRASFVFEMMYAAGPIESSPIR